MRGKTIKLGAILLSTSLMAAPFLLFAQGLVPCGQGNYSQCTLCDLFVLISRVIDFLLNMIILPASVVAFIIAGILFLTAAGDERKITQAKGVFSGVVWGLVISFGAWLIIDTLLRTLVDEGRLFGSMPWNAFPTCGGPVPPM